MNEEILLRSIYERIDVPIFVIQVVADGDFIFSSLNAACVKTTGLRKEEVIGKRPEEISSLPKQGAAALRANCRRCLEADEAILCEEPFVDHEQRTRWRMQLTPVRDETGKIVQIIGFSINDEVKRAEDEELYRMILTDISDSVFLTDDAGNLTFICPNVDYIFGYSPDEMYAMKNIDALLGPGLLDDVRSEMARVVLNVEREATDKQGKPLTLLINIKAVSTTSGTRLFTCRDITERKRAEDALRRSEAEKAILNRIASVFLTIPGEAMFGEVLAVVLQVMKSEFGLFGHIGDNGDLVVPGSTREIWNERRVPGKSIVIPPDSWGSSLWSRAIREKKAFYSDGTFHTPAGHIYIENILTVPIVYGPETIGLVSVASKEGGYTEEDRDLLERIAFRISPILHARLQRDLQEQRRMKAEADLKESEEKYRLLITNAGEAIFIIQDEVVKFPNPRASEMVGYTGEELAEIPFVDLIHPSDKEAVLERHLRLLERKQPEPYPFRIIDKKGRAMWVQLTTAPTIWEKKPGILCFLRDVTEEKKLKSQLLQAQKMEAVGRLAGGVAHDFNNMLSVIIGHTEMALMITTSSDRLYLHLQDVNNAARRSADLTRQLLAFARKQTIAPKVLDLNDTVSGMLNMLRRLIGEDIELAWCPGAELWPVMMDPGQIDQVLANLCVNARDAIAGTGKINIETSNTAFDETYRAGHYGPVPVEYVLLAVSDDGCGMDEETQAHLFEPFFTTKEIGQGTGLGLATVYGIVKQNDGFISVYSELGQGTTFKIYLPRHQAAPGEILEESAVETLLGGTETVLMVEDEKAVLELGKVILETLGYTVLIANTPGEAIRLAEEYTGEIHLLLTDVVMPEMNGRELVQRIAPIRPSLKYLYMSGYTANVIADRGVLEEGVHFIQKPFSIKDLAVRVRLVLDRKSTVVPG